MMKTLQLTSVVLSIFLFANLYGQDCYNPPSGSTLYTTNLESYNLPSITGLVTPNELSSGSWSVRSTTGNIEAQFLDNSGRTSTLRLSGQGQVVIRNIQTDLSESQPSVTQCDQVYNVRNYKSSIFRNPALESYCPLKMVVVIDESASIANSKIQESIKNGVRIFGDLLSYSGSEMAIVEYDSKARRVEINGSEELQAVTPEFLDGLEEYLETEYNPVSDELKLVGGTNWQDALIYANKIKGAEFILMLTDGNPTFYNVPNSTNGTIAGEGENFDLTALKYAQDAANKIKKSNKHLFVIGVDIPNTKQALIDISGGQEFKFGGDINSLVTSDFASVEASDIERIFKEVGIETCGNVVPTLGEWGLVNLGLLLLIVGVVSIKNSNKIVVLTSN